MDIDTLAVHIESVLFATEKPMSRKSLETLFEVSQKEIDEALVQLRNTLENRGITLVEADHEVMLRAVSNATKYITKIRHDELSQDLGKAGLETLAIILYRGGAYRNEIDWVRGVRSSATIQSLSMRGLIEGFPDSKDKRKIRYHATTDAMSYLGITRKEELPQHDELMHALSDNTKEMEADALS